MRYIAGVMANNASSNAPSPPVVNPLPYTGAGNGGVITYVTTTIPSQGWFIFAGWPPSTEEVSEEPPPSNGCTCKKCLDIFPYAIPNQSDKKTFICWACRNGF